jgi:hypothetical protein
MKCPKCQFDNKEGAKFCLQCGERLELQCPQCGKPLPLLAKFCDECGQRLEVITETEKAVPQTEGERKYVTVLFSDLSGYTAMSERLDPEEVKEITSRIFGEISKVINKYEGFVEKFVGDAVMALFGVPNAHEDDPLRAIRVAREIHELVDAVSPKVEKRIGQPISMHTATTRLRGILPSKDWSRPGSKVRQNRSRSTRPYPRRSSHLRPTVTMA